VHGVDTLITLLQQHGLWLVFANVLALQLGLPLPAWPTLIVVAALPGGPPFAAALAVAVAASLIADLVWFAAGRRHGRRVLRTLCRVSLSPDSCVQQTERLYSRWGPPSLAVAKFIPGFAAVATSMAGLVGTPLSRFLPFDALGAALWSGAALGLGRLFAGAVNELLAVLEAAGRWGLITLVALLALSIAFKALQRWRLIRRLRMARISVDELAQLIERGERPLVVDVRSPAAQAQGRIPGAVWVDAQAFDDSLHREGLRERLDDEVIVYCACPNEVSAAAVAQKLYKAGFRRVRPLGGGIEAWEQAGYEIARD
jgi:membrane protein DedA with SNARE-associated domain